MRRPTASITARVNLVKAMVPLLPILLLSSTRLVGPNTVTQLDRGPARILAAMMIGVVAAGLDRASRQLGAGTAFFEGAGYAYHHVISLIVVASTFAEGIRLSGLIGLLIRGDGPLAGRWRWSLRRWPPGSWRSSRAPASRRRSRSWSSSFPRPGSMGIDPIRLGTLTCHGRALRPHDEPGRGGGHDVGPALRGATHWI